jgi:hypothetical protein
MDVSRLAALKSLVEGRVGRENALTADALGERLGMTNKDRGWQVREMILFLIWDKGLAVVADGDGFYTPASWAEWEVYDRQMKGRIAEDAKRRVQVKKNVFNHFHGTKVVRLV